MTDFEVAVPSYARAGVLGEQTLATLARGRVPADAVTVFVGSSAEADEYRAVLDPAAYGRIVVTGATGSLTGQRNFIARHYPRGTRLVCADDDLRAVEVLSPDGLQEAPDLAALLGEAFRAAEQTGAWLWGVYAARNAYFMRQRPPFTGSLAYIIGALWGTTLRHLPCELVTADAKEDYERTLRYFRQDGAVCRMNHVTLRTRYFAQGGMLAAGRSPEQVARHIRLLQEEFPGMVRINSARRSAYPEIILRAPRAEAI